MVFTSNGQEKNIIKNSLSVASVGFVKFYFLTEVMSTRVFVLLFSKCKKSECQEFLIREIKKTKYNQLNFKNYFETK